MYNSRVNKKSLLFFVIFVIVAVIALGLFSKQVFKTSNTPNNTSTNTSTPGKIDKKNFLDLSNQGLEKLPAYVLKITDLEELNISNNRLTGALPAEIHDLKSLRVLNAANNLMTGVPAEVGQLQNLEVLDLSNNKLTGLPNELGNLKKLKMLNLSGNNYSKQDLEVIKKDLSPSVEIIL